MQRIVLALILGAIGGGQAIAGPLSLNPERYPNSFQRADTAAPGPAVSEPQGAPAAEAQPTVIPARYAGRSDLGGGFIEFLFGGTANQRAQQPRYEEPQPRYQEPAAPAQFPFPFFAPRIEPAEPYAAPQPVRGEPAEREIVEPASPAKRAMDPRFLKQVVAYQGSEKPGTIIINTPERMLYLVQEDGKALRYGIGVGRPGFTWAGVKSVSQKREWPDWIPPEEMLKRRPDLPRYMPGGPDNPLGARAMYLGSSLYRIHGSNEPWTIGQAVSSGCIRMRNEDVIDLYNRVKLGTRVVVI
jgi:lipoprotein-anchoring transpeptidase ErfK/SrfK